MARMSSNLIMGLAGTISWGISALVMIAFIVAIAITVRKHRPDAAPLLLGATIVEFLISLAGLAASYLIPRLVTMGGTSGYDRYVGAQALSSVTFSVAHAAARILLLWGLLRLAQPPQA